MRKTIQKVFARYGTDATVYDGVTVTTIKVFFQSVNSKSWQNMEAEYHPLGQLYGGQYVCFLPPDAVVEEGYTLTVGGKNYAVCRVENMPAGFQPVYRWAICTGKGRREQSE